MEGNNSQLCARVTAPDGFGRASLDQVNATYLLLATTSTYGDGIHLYKLYLAPCNLESILQLYMELYYMTVC